MKLSIAPALFAALCLAHFARAEDNPDERIKKALSRKVSFEFVDTPLADGIEFIRHLANVAIIMDPRVVAAGKDKTPISLRVADMDMDKALQWILKLAELEYKVQDQAIYIAAPNVADAADVEKKARGDAGDGSLRVRFTGGDMLEADAALLRANPQFAQELVSLAYDPARDGILVLVPGRDFPQGVRVPAFMDSAMKIAPDAKLEFDDNLRLLYVRSDNAGDLRRVNTLARALRRAALPPPAPPPPAPLRLAQKLTLKFDDTKAIQVLDVLARTIGANPRPLDESVPKTLQQTTVSLDVRDAEAREVLDTLSKLTHLRFQIQGNEILISPLPTAEAVKPPKAPEEPPPKGKAKTGENAEPQF
ncbi:MAG TPA: STN domain-containing protein [Planctomycetota bacterium]|nr:STN domain-containing protein [Planctomycetota bacterium]